MFCLNRVMRSPLTGLVFTLVLKRSVLTEKTARRGLHLTREYSTDPLETFFVHEVMRPQPLTLQQDAPIDDGLLDRVWPTRPAGAVADAARELRVQVRPDDTLRYVAHRFAEHDLTGAPVVRDSLPPTVVGIITLADLPHARRYDLTEEHHRERLITRPARRRTPDSGADRADRPRWIRGRSRCSTPGPCRRPGTGRR